MKLSSLKGGIIVLFLCLSSNNLWATTWEDPEWEEMLRGSKIIALVEYVMDGSFEAKAKIVKIYKGKIKNDEIWIGGFSDPYGPLDSMQVGDRYIVFLKPNTYEPKVENKYRVWTPTSGDLRVVGQKVQYDLIQTTFYRNQPFHSLEEFEEFLNISTKNSRKDFQYKILAKLKSESVNEKASQYLMMLYLSKFKEYDSVYEELVLLDDSPEIIFALTKLLGQVKDSKALDLLLNLLESENTIIQGEVVRQLAKEKVSFIGPIFLSYLKSSNDGGIYPSNIMNPVRNQIDGGKIQIIITLGEIGYKNAVPELLKMLEIDNEYVFLTTIDALNKLGESYEDYVPYFNKHLEKGSDDVILEMCRMITDYELEECVPSLMKFVQNYGRTSHIYTFTISDLAYFDSDTVRTFLKTDFLEVLKMEDEKGLISKKISWLEDYLERFVHLNLEVEGIKPALYDCLFNYYGLNINFKNNPQFFERKFLIEDSIRNVVNHYNIDNFIERIKVVAFLNETTYQLDNYVLKLQFPDVRDDEYLERMLEAYESNTEFIDENRMVVEEIVSSIDSAGISKSHMIVEFNRKKDFFTEDIIKDFDDFFMISFLDYISTFPDKLDIQFLENLKKYNYYDNNIDIRKLDAIILKAKENLQ